MILEWISQHPDVTLALILAEHLGMFVAGWLISKVRLMGK